MEKTVHALKSEKNGINESRKNRSDGKTATVN